MSLVALRVRVAMVAGAIVVCTWFALGIRQAHDTARANAIVSRSSAVSAAQAARAGSALRAAAVLNPDSQVDVLRARVALLEHDRPLAVRILEGVVHREPDNLQAWLSLAEASRKLRVIDLAVSNVARLDPMVARRR